MSLHNQMRYLNLPIESKNVTKFNFYVCIRIMLILHLVKQLFDIERVDFQNEFLNSMASSKCETMKDKMYFSSQRMTSAQVAQ